MRVILTICFRSRMPRTTRFEQGDIANRATVRRVLAAHSVDTVVNFAAESHVDRSILDPDAFIMTDVVGVYTLLDEARQLGINRLHHVSTTKCTVPFLRGFSARVTRLSEQSVRGQ